jgi:threonine-phosphate decarboxylase
MTSPVPIDRVHGGATPRGAIDFSISVNPLGPPAAAIAAYHDALPRIATYPPAKSAMLEERLAEWLGVAKENVLAGNGTTQLIYLLARVLEPARPFVVVPTFSEIANALAGEGLPPEPIQLAPERDYRLDIRQIDDALAGHAGAIFFGRPNSPTGSTVVMTMVGEIASRCGRRGCWCVIDEAFVDFADPFESAVAIAAGNPRMIVLRSLTKSFAIPGLRLGCVVAAEEVLSALRDSIEPWSVNVVAESVGVACLEHANDYLKRTRELVARERAYLLESLRKIDGVRVFPSVANFLMLEVTGESGPGDFGRQLLNCGLAVRDLGTMPGCTPGLYRIGIRSHADNERLVREISHLQSTR